ncbi:MAG: hypothetical protein F4049_03720 [Gemmatimonadetes bacterium]|nr:hypothetical protein [Gemmatimonadota bacterium]
MLIFLVVFLVSTIIVLSLLKTKDRDKGLIRFFGFVSLASLVAMTVLSLPVSDAQKAIHAKKPKPYSTPISTSKPAKAKAPLVQAGQQKERSFSGNSPTCGPIVGNSRADLQNVKRFCSQAVVEGTVVGAYAKREILWVKINGLMARGMDQDPLSSERLVKTWMKGWKKITGEPVVTIYVEWGDIEIAKGQTTAFSGDKVNLRK